MANWSAFSVGGLDPILTGFERKWQREDSRWSDRRQIEQAVNMRNLEQAMLPQELSITASRLYNNAFASVGGMRQALESHGYNPLLAIDSVGGSSGAAAPVLSTNSARLAGVHAGTTGASGGSPFDWANARQMLKNNELQGDAIKANIALTKASAAKVAKETEIMGYSTIPNSIATLFKSDLPRAVKAMSDHNAKSNTAKTVKDAAELISKELNLHHVSPADGDYDINKLKSEGVMLVPQFIKEDEKKPKGVYIPLR